MNFSGLRIIGYLQLYILLSINQDDIETDFSGPAAKRLKQEPSDEEEGVSAEEMSLYYSSPTSSDTSQVH